MSNKTKKIEEIEYPKSYKNIAKASEGWFYRLSSPSTRVYYKTPNEAGIAIHGKQEKSKTVVKNNVKK